MEKTTVVLTAVETETAETVNVYEQIEHIPALRYFALSMQDIADNGIDTNTLIAMAQSGDAVAMEQLFHRYYKLLLKLVYNNREFFADLESEILSACVDGFIQAVNDYKDEVMKYSFTTIVCKRAKMKIREVLASLGGAISLSVMTYRRIRLVGKLLADGMTVNEIAQKMKCTPKMVRIYASHNKEVWMENIHADDTEYTSTNEMYDHLEELVDNHLFGLENKIVRHYFGLRCNPKKLNEISEKFGIEYTKVKRTSASAMAKLKTLA